VHVTKGDTRKVLLQVQLWAQKPTSARVQAEPPSGETPKPPSTEAALDMHVEPLSELPSESPLSAGDTAADLGGKALPKKPDEPTSSPRDASAAVLVEALSREPQKPASTDREALQADALPGEFSSAKDMSAAMHTELRSVAGLNVPKEQLGDPSALPSVAVHPDGQAASLLEPSFPTSAGVPERVLEQGKAAGIESLIREEERSTGRGGLKNRELTREGAWALWPSKAVRELNLDATHRALPALADVALPCQLAAAVATWQTRRTLREERIAEREAGREAARVYGVLEEEECVAARVRKALQERKAAAKAAEKAEVAEKRRLAREARRRAAGGMKRAGVNAPCVDELDDLVDVPIGSLAVSADKAGLGAGQPEDASPVVVRRRLRGRRRAIEEDDDVSDPGADVITAPGAPGGRSLQVDSSSGRPKSGEASLLDQACSVCGGTGGEESMLLCDEGGCQGALHTYCAQPPIEEVPEGDWFCAECTASKKAIGAEVGGVERSDEKEGVERPELEGAVELEGAREPLAQSANEATRQQGPDCGQPEGEGVDELERVKESPVARVEAAFCQQRAKDGQEGLQKGDDFGGKDSSGGVNELERVEGSLVPSAEEALCPQGAGCGQLEEEGLQKEGGCGGQDSEAGFNELERVEALTAEETIFQQGPEDGQGGPQKEARCGARDSHGGVSELERLEGLPVQDGNNGQGGLQQVGNCGGQDLNSVCVAEQGGTQGEKMHDVSKVDSAPNGEGFEVGGLSPPVREAGSSPVEGLDSGAPMETVGELQTQERISTAQQISGAHTLDLEDPQIEAAFGGSEGSGIPRSSAPPLEEVAQLQVEELRALVSGASRKAVAISAAVWRLTDDLSASDLMSHPRGSESVADAAPGCKEGDNVEGRVPRQVAACLAYTSLRWSLDTCQFGRTAGDRTEWTDWETEAELVTATGTAPLAPGSGVLGGTVGGSPASPNPPQGMEVIGNETQILSNPSESNGRGIDAGVGAVSRWTECEWALGGPGRLLAAAADGAALSGFLAAGEGDAEPGWLQLQLGAATEQRGVER
jgi:hypothetical protein